MDPRLLQYYNRELQHLRDVGAEFAREYPKIAGRLALDEFACLDPYVERLLEGFAFLAARTQLKVDAQFPEFIQHLLEVVYPHYLSPTPSMAVVQFSPDLNEGNLGAGVTIPRGTTLRSQLPKAEQTTCEYRTCHDVTLWPIQLVNAEYIASPAAIANLGIPLGNGAKAGLRLRLRVTAGLSFAELALDKLAIFLLGAGDMAGRLYEQLLGNALAAGLLTAGTTRNWRSLEAHPAIRSAGFHDDEAILPATTRSFSGYRLLLEYFAFPERFQFIELSGFQEALTGNHAAEADLFVLFDRCQPTLINAVEVNQFALFCAPIVNLFPKRADRIHLDFHTPEYHIVPDRTRPMDFDVYSVQEVTGIGADGQEQTFLPFFGSKTTYRRESDRAYYTLARRKRVLSSKQKRLGLRSSYIGHESFISLVDSHQTPFSSDLKQLDLKLMCTNRDLPLVMPVGIGESDFSLQVGAPVSFIKILAGPTRPKASAADREVSWKLISHLSLNYLSLAGAEVSGDAAGFRELLMLYSDFDDNTIRKKIEGVLEIHTRNVVRRMDNVGPMVFGRGLEVAVKIDETAFQGSGIFIFGAVLEQFLARYASINSFTETVVQSADRGEIMRWPIRSGLRQTI